MLKMYSIDGFYCSEQETCDPCARLIDDLPVSIASNSYSNLHIEVLVWCIQFLVLSYSLRGAGRFEAQRMASTRRLQAILMNPESLIQRWSLGVCCAGIRCDPKFISWMRTEYSTWGCPQTYQPLQSVLLAGVALAGIQALDSIDRQVINAIRATTAFVPAHQRCRVYL